MKTTAFLAPIVLPAGPLTTRLQCARRPSIAATTLPPPSNPIPRAQAPLQPSRQEQEQPTVGAARSGGTVIVPGKFDSFHIGHRQLTETAAQLGVPTLLSFSGMSRALQWAPRAPVVADVERDRVMCTWSAESQVHIAWRVVPFELVRGMTPDQFLEYIVDEFAAVAIVCGPDWRFGNQRVGDVAMLHQLAPKHGLRVEVVHSVLASGVVSSSTRVRTALLAADVALAANLLGRLHRLVGYALRVDDDDRLLCGDFVNMAPAPATYEATVRVIGRAEPLRTQVTVFVKNDEPYASVENAERIYCVDCEIYIDFISRIPHHK